MRNIAIGFVLISLAVVGSIEATAQNAPLPGDEPVGVRFTMGAPGEGVLEIYNADGRELFAHNIMGEPVAMGPVQDAHTVEFVPNAWVGPGGEVLYVNLGEKHFECNVTDPDWQWD